MMRISKWLLLFSFFIFYSNIKAETGKVRLDIKGLKVNGEKINCNFIYHVAVPKSDSIDLFQIILPFQFDKKLPTILAKDPNLIVSYGFNSSGKGLMLINSNGKAVTFDVEFTDVELPLKKFPGNENGLIVSLDFTTRFIFDKLSSPGLLNLFEFRIHHSPLLTSDPKFRLDDSDTYLLSSNIPLENVYFAILKPRESLLSAFIACLVLAIIIGIVGAVKILNGKLQSILGLVASLLFSLYLGYLFLYKILPENFTQDIDMISLVGGGIGLCIGIMANAVYNLIVIITIERQQSS